MSNSNTTEDDDLVWPHSLRRHARPGERVEAATETTAVDIVDRLRMIGARGHGIGVVSRAAKAEIERLRVNMLSVQRAAFNAGYDAGMADEDPIAAYAEWSKDRG